MNSKYNWYVKKDIDLTKYGLTDVSDKYDYFSYMYFSEKMKSSKIYVRKIDNLLSFSNITNESLLILSQMIKDDVMYCVDNKNYYVKKTISKDEWEMIKKMRGEK